MRPFGRVAPEVRAITFSRHYTKHAEGSVLVTLGATQVLCTASVETGVPRFLKGKNQGWITAEYGMLPRATHIRNSREARKGKQSGRTQEIQRLIGRSLRAMVDLSILGDYTITVDCDVIQADGGTRTAAINGAAIAVTDAVATLLNSGKISQNPLKGLVAAISVGIVEDEPRCDLEYCEDSIASTDMNIVMSEDLRLIEIQGTAEGAPFSHEALLALLTLAKTGIEAIFEQQRLSLQRPFS